MDGGVFCGHILMSYMIVNMMGAAGKRKTRDGKE